MQKKTLKTPLRILLSNDDGIQAPGLRILYRELKKLGSVTVVAPLEEKSTAGHSLTLHKPLRLIPIPSRNFGWPGSENKDGDFFACTGSPADCVYLGVREVLKGKPDIVVSGPNRGPNLGQDVYYSGTVSAAREATILGIPSIAVSLALNYDKADFLAEENRHYDSASKVTVKLIRELLIKRGYKIPEHTLLNLNVPDLPMNKIRGLRLARQGFRYYSGSILRRRDHRGKDYFWVGGSYEGYRKEKGTDCYVVEQGYASLTPVRLDSTDPMALANLAALGGKGSKKLTPKEQTLGDLNW